VDHLDVIYLLESRILRGLTDPSRQLCDRDREGYSSSKTRGWADAGPGRQSEANCCK